MARVLYGAIVTEIKGKVNGLVFQKMGSTFGMRTYKNQYPNKGTSSQKKRTTWAITASLWKTLTPTQKLSYKNNAASYPTLDKFGNPVVLNQFQLFMLINQILVIWGYPIITTCSAYSNPYNLYYEVGSLNATNQHFYLNRVNTMPAGVFQVWFVAGPFPSYTYNQNLKGKTFNIVRLGTGSSVNFWSNVVNLFNYPPTNDDWVVVSSYVVDSNTGLYSSLSSYQGQMNT
jgi:hypothetical protein